MSLPLFTSRYNFVFFLISAMTDIMARPSQRPWRVQITQLLFMQFPLKVENVNLRGYKWNETVSNRIRCVSNRICNVK
jgi:hypothetical protein